MAKVKKIEDGTLGKFNRTSHPVNIIWNIVFILLSLTAILPLLLVIAISISSKESLGIYGYQFIPKEISLEAYKYIWAARKSVSNALFVSLFVTVGGTVVGLILNTTIAYSLSRPTFKFKKLFTILVFIPMLFNGGMISFYMIVTQFLKLGDTIWSLILPMAVSSFYIIVLRTFFQTTVPDEIIESGKMDGASQLTIFTRIVLPISLPAIATIGLFLSFAYWNDWYNALLFVNKSTLVPLQFFLMKIENNIKFMQENESTIAASSSGLIMSLPTEGVRMAIVVLVVLPIAASYPFFQKYFISGLTVGAVKG